MRARSFDPRRLDPTGFGRAGGRLDGRLPVAGFARLRDSLHPEAQPSALPDVEWSAQGELRERPGVDPQPWLRLVARVQLPLVCQRCLGPVEGDVEVDRTFRFERDEDAAAAADAEAEEDVLSLGAPVDLVELLEDELLLSLPLVPRHDRCPQPLPVPAPAVDEAAGERPNPFAALAALKAGGRPPGEEGGPGSGD